MENEKVDLKTKKTTGKRKNRVKNDLPPINVEKSNSYPVAQRYIKWFKDYASKEDTIVANLFYGEYDVSMKTFQRLMEEYPDLKADYYEILELIAARREKGALMNKYNSAVFLQTQAMYSKGYKQMREEFLKLKAELANAKAASGVVHIHLPELEVNDNEHGNTHTS